MFQCAIDPISRVVIPLFDVMAKKKKKPKKQKQSSLKY